MPLGDQDGRLAPVRFGDGIRGFADLIGHWHGRYIPLTLRRRSDRRCSVRIAVGLVMGALR